jgi:phosphotriesterase-related protein
VTLIHEHISIGPSGVLLDSRVRSAFSDRLRIATAKLTAAKALGVDTLVDATPIDLNRDVALLHEVSQATGVNIVCATGVFMETHGLPAYFRDLSADELASLYIEEIENGIGESRIKAGVIKAASPAGGITPLNRKCLEAAGMAQARTGVPVVTHTAGGYGDEQASALIDAGAAPEKIVVGHVDHKYSSPAYLDRILCTGANLGFDRCGNEIFLKDLFRAGLIASLVASGVERRIFLSMDAVAVNLGSPSRYDNQYHEPFVYLVRDFAELLATFGVSRDSFRDILSANPAWLFGDGDALPTRSDADGCCQ